MDALPDPAADRPPEVESRLQLEMLPQPTQTSCGPTCLHAIYRYHGDALSLDQVVREVPSLKTGGTLDVLLGRHALQRGYQVTIYTFNLLLFDPSWFPRLRAADLCTRLEAQAELKPYSKLRFATRHYRRFLEAGGRIRLEDLTAALVRRYLKRGVPLIAGLSDTFLYRDCRVFGPDDVDDDLRGHPSGHFVVLYGYRPGNRHVLVADPLRNTPFGPKHYYELPIERVLCAILLGIVTFDSNLIVIEPKS